LEGTRYHLGEGNSFQHCQKRRMKNMNVLNQDRL